MLSARSEVAFVAVSITDVGARAIADGAAEKRAELIAAVTAYMYKLLKHNSHPQLHR